MLLFLLYIEVHFCQKFGTWSTNRRPLNIDCIERVALAERYLVISIVFGFFKVLRYMTPGVLSGTHYNMECYQIRLTPTVTTSNKTDYFILQNDFSRTHLFSILICGGNSVICL